MAEQSPGSAESTTDVRPAQPKTNAERLRSALIASSGEFTTACRMIGLPVQEARHLVRVHPDIKELLKTDIDEVDALHRPDTIALDPRSEIEAREDEARIGKMVKLENDKLLNGLSAVGVSAPDADIILGYQYLAGKCFRDTVEAMHGGMVATYFNLIQERNTRKSLADSVDELLSLRSIYPPGSEARKSLVEECKVLRSQLREVDQMVVKCNEVLHRSALVMALQKSKEKTKEKKLGFDSTPVDV